MADMPELLPCPFCGGKPEGPIDATKVLGVWRIVHRGCVIPNFSVDRSQKESAITAWNTRAPDPRVTALVEAAEALDRAVSEVTRYGAQTGSQWTRLSIASLKFRAALAAFKEDTKNGD